MTEKIDWNILLGDLGMQAYRKACDDPQCIAELKPIQDAMRNAINMYKEQEEAIIRKYKVKYFDQLCAERENQTILFQAAMSKVAEKHQ